MPPKSGLPLRWRGVGRGGVKEWSIEDSVAPLEGIRTLVVVGTMPLLDQGLIGAAVVFPDRGGHG